MRTDSITWPAGSLVAGSWGGIAAASKLGRMPRRNPRANPARADLAVTAILEDDYSDAPGSLALARHTVRSSAFCWIWSAVFRVLRLARVSERRRSVFINRSGSAFGFP